MAYPHRRYAKQARHVCDLIVHAMTHIQVTPPDWIVRGSLGIGAGIGSRHFLLEVEARLRRLCRHLEREEKYFKAVNVSAGPKADSLHRWWIKHKKLDLEEKRQKLQKRRKDFTCA